MVLKCLMAGLHGSCACAGLCMSPWDVTLSLTCIAVLACLDHALHGASLASVRACCMRLDCQCKALTEHAWAAWGPRAVLLHSLQKLASRQTALTS